VDQDNADVNRVEALPAGADVVVIGGGVIGAATAFFASRAGLQTLVLERRPAVCSLTTAVAGGGYRLQQDNERDYRIVEESLEILEGFADLTGQRRYDPRIQPQGYLWITGTEEPKKGRNASVGWSRPKGDGASTTWICSTAPR